MSGELHDFEYPDQPKLYDIRTIESGYILKTTCTVLGLYYIIVKPLEHYFPDRFPKPDMKKENEYYGKLNRIAPPFPTIFRSWREYQNIQ